ncbi:MAG: hypothetical protein ABG776_15210 [Cyanobacteria bacterium J06555_13]
MAIHNTPSEEAAKREGYVQGRSDENYVQRGVRSQERAIANARSTDNAASGMVFGLVIALLAALVGGGFFLLSGDRTTNVVPVSVPDVETPSVTEIELPDVEVNVPDVEAPDVNITETAPAEAE